MFLFDELKAQPLSAYEKLLEEAVFAQLGISAKASISKLERCEGFGAELRLVLMPDLSK